MKKRADLHGTLDGLDRSTLISMLFEYADENKSFKESLLFRFTEKSDTVSYSAKLITASIKNAMSQGFVEYADVHAAIQGAEKVLEMISMNKDIFEAVELYRLVLCEMIDLKRYCDDSNGYIGGVITRAFQ